MPETSSPVPEISLNDGRRIPQLGFGVFQVPPEDTPETTGVALSTGYRHIDTAEMYENEAGVGEALRASDLDRDAVWITSKLNNDFSEPDAIRAAFEETLQKLGVDQIDLFLIHWPLPRKAGSDFVTRWKTLEEFKADGRARSIGVSNFQVAHLERLAAECDVAPAVNQIELHPYFQNQEVREYGESHGIATEAWSPIAQGDVLDDVAVTAVADEVARTPGQVVLRWHIQRDSIVFPKSSTPDRIRENFDLFDFELSDAQMAAITGLDKGEKGRRGPNPDEMGG